MTDTVRDRNRHLYGRPRIPRSHRRVMLALLAADGLSGWPLCHLAQASAGTVYVVLAKLEDRGWVDREQDANSGRAFYALNSEGRKAVRLLLGLEAFDD